MMWLDHASTPRSSDSVSSESWYASKIPREALSTAKLAFCIFCTCNLLRASVGCRPKSTPWRASSDFQRRLYDWNSSDQPYQSVFLINVSYTTNRARCNKARWLSGWRLAKKLNGTGLETRAITRCLCDLICTFSTAVNKTFPSASWSCNVTSCCLIVWVAQKLVREYNQYIPPYCHRHSRTDHGLVVVRTKV